MQSSQQGMPFSRPGMPLRQQGMPFSLNCNPAPNAGTSNEAVLLLRAVEAAPVMILSGRGIQRRDAEARRGVISHVRFMSRPVYLDRASIRLCYLR